MTNGRAARRWTSGLLAAALGLAVGCHNGTEAAIQDRNDTALRNALKDGADVNEIGGHGFTPLIFAVRDNNLSACHILVENKANVNAQDKRGETALMYAADQGNRPIVQFLLDSGADVNITSNHGATALGYAKGGTGDLIRSHGGQR